MSKPMKLLGQMRWFSDYGVDGPRPIARALLHERRLEIELQYGGICYGLSLESADGVSFAGVVQARNSRYHAERACWIKDLETRIGRANARTGTITA